MKIDETGRIIQFAEKPKGPALKAMVHIFGLPHQELLLIKYSLTAAPAFTLSLLLCNLRCTSNILLQQVDTSILGLSELEAANFHYMASMGVYVFKSDVLLKLLKSAYPSCNDFGSEIIPSAVRDHNVQVRAGRYFLNCNFSISKVHKFCCSLCT